MTKALILQYHKELELLIYLLGSFLALAWKLLRALHFGRKEGKKAIVIIDEWFFGKSAEDRSSWIATVAGVWVLGALFIYEVGIDWMIPDSFKMAPAMVHFSVNFFFGTVSEYIVPSFIKMVVRVITGKFESTQGK